MSYGREELYGLLTDSSVTDLLTDGVGGIWYSTVLPNTTDTGDSTINYYRSTAVEGGLNYLRADYSVNCRADTMAKAEAIARAVFDVVNRHYNDSVYFVCSVLGVISPQDETDVYNAPVEVVTKGRDV